MVCGSVCGLPEAPPRSHHFHRMPTGQMQKARASKSMQKQKAKSMTQGTFRRQSPLWCTFQLGKQCLGNQCFPIWFRVLGLWIFLWLARSQPWSPREPSGGKNQHVNPMEESVGHRQVKAMLFNMPMPWPRELSEGKDQHVNPMEESGNHRHGKAMLVNVLQCVVCVALWFAKSQPWAPKRCTSGSTSMPNCVWQC